ncbi:MAG: ArsR/SmtB family transcription factor [Candidatus Anstonellales archaeon]
MKTKIIKAVCDETRLELLLRLQKSEACACELPIFVKVSQPAVSQHLKVLLEAGLVEMRKKGTRRIYSLSRKGAKVLKDISRWENENRDFGNRMLKL